MMDTFNSYNELAIANDSAPYIPMNLRDAALPSGAETDNMSPKLKGMPAYKGADFFAETNEEQHGGILEPAHTYIMIGKQKAKFWLVNPSTPLGTAPVFQVTPAKINQIPSHISNDIVRHLVKHKAAVIRAWNDYVDNKHPESTGRKIPEK